MRTRIMALLVTLAWTTVDVAAAGKTERLVVVKSTKRIVDFGQSALIEGRWKLVGQRNADFSLARVNASFIQCSRSTGMCEETVAELRTPEDGERLGVESGELLASCHTYEVTEWSDAKLVAVSHKDVADLVIRIDFKALTAERLFREREDPTQFNSYTLE